jgi:hypothetical protein
MLQWLREKLRLSRSDSTPENYPSVVILLREPQIRTSNESLNLVRRALGAGIDVELIGVLDNGNAHIIRNGKFFFTFHQASQRYEVPGYEPIGLVRKAWDENKAWVAFDMPTQSSAKLREIDSLGTAYRLLLVFTFLCWSPNCLGVYFPAERVSVPNLGDLADSINWARRNGQNLDFLNTPKNELK